MRKYRILAKWKDKVIPPSHADFEVALEAVRDMQLLAFIFLQEHWKNRQPKLMGFLKKLTQDPALPENKHSPGRDTQFEIFVAAVCQAANLNPVDYEEPPDVTCNLRGVKLGIAAKRLKSAAQAHKRIPEAADQIENSKALGVIVFDTTFALNPNNWRAGVPMPDDQFVKLHKLKVDWFLSKYDPQIRVCTQRHGVLGVIVHDHEVRFEPDGSWSLSSMTVDFCTAKIPSARKLFKDFKTLYVSSLPNHREVPK